MAGRELPVRPGDIVSRVAFTPNAKLLLVASWDESVRIIDVASQTVKTKYNHKNAVMDAVCESNTRCFSGGLDRVLKSFDFYSGSEQVVGGHNDAIRCVDHAPDVNAIVTGSWDTFVKVWDVRQRTPVITAPQSDKVYAMSVAKHNLVVGTAQRKVMIWDLRNLAYPQQKRESNLKYQTRCIKCFPDGQGFVLASIEGRVSVEYMDPSAEMMKKKYAFKCHRLKEGDIECIYPINAIDFHRVYGTFATGGSDGYVNVWDGVNKKRLTQIHRFPTGVTSLAFSPDGSVIAVGCSYMYEDREPSPIPPPSVFIRNVTDAETKPK